jgi:hypothetical protein
MKLCEKFGWTPEECGRQSWDKIMRYLAYMELEEKIRQMKMEAKGGYGC